MSDELRRLVERAQQHEAEAWDALYRRVRSNLDAYARRRLPGDDADDAVSETMARALEGIDRFAWTGAGVEAWLIGILRHVVLEAYQRAGRQRVEVALEREVLDPTDGPIDLVVTEESAARVRAALGRLRDADRVLLELRFVDALDAAATGALLGKGAGAVRMAQMRALDRLRCCYVAERARPAAAPGGDRSGPGPSPRPPVL